MKAKRPVYLNLWQIKFPCMAIVSILHRASGVILFLLLPFLLGLLSQSLKSADTFNDLHQALVQPGWRFLLWVVLSSLSYHLFAGIRHIIMDTGIGDSLKGGRLGAYAVLIVSAISIVLLGIWLW